MALAAGRVRAESPPPAVHRVGSGGTSTGTGGSTSTGGSTGGSGGAGGSHTGGAAGGGTGGVVGTGGMTGTGGSAATGGVTGAGGSAGKGGAGGSGTGGTPPTSGAFVNTYDGARTTTASFDLTWKFHLGDVTRRAGHDVRRFVLDGARRAARLEHQLAVQPELAGGRRRGVPRRRSGLVPKDLHLAGVQRGPEGSSSSSTASTWTAPSI